MAKKIPLTHGKFATVDDENYEWAMQWEWYAWWTGKTWYACRDVGQGKRKRRIYMHEEIVKKAIAEQQEAEKWRGKLN